LSLLRMTFFKKQRFGNALDFLIVVGYVLDIFLEKLVNLTSLRALKFIRFLHAARIVWNTSWTSRSVRLVLSSLSSILRALFWSMVALTFAIYLNAIVFVQVAQMHIIESKHEPSIVSPSFQRFGSTTEAMWTFFMTVSGGISWQEVVQPFDNVSCMSRLIFLPCIILFSFCFCFLIAGILIDSVLQFSTVKRDAMVRETMAQRSSPLQNLRRMLIMDKFTKDGFIGRRRLNRLLREDDTAAMLEPLKMDAEQLEGLAKILDSDDVGTVCIEELVLSIMQLKGSANPVATMMYDSKRITVRMNQLSRFVDDCFTHLQAMVGSHR